MDPRITAPLPKVGGTPLQPPTPSTVSTETPSGVLWSRTTAEEIVAVIAEDAATGALALAEALELIDRVWQRAGP